jgi:plastocyanin
MAGIDKAAIVFSMAIALVGVGIAVAGNSIDYSPSVSTPIVSSETSSEPKTSSSFGADLAAKVKEEALKMEEVKVEEKTKESDEMKSMELEEEISMKETQDETHDETHDETMMKEPAGPTTHNVDIPAGTSTPGCESNNSCFIPADITINAGDTVNWVNVDTAAHTVTGGNPSDGPSGVFDSSLVMGSASYAFTFNDKGSFDYFCMVHPWMVGSVTVN